MLHLLEWLELKMHNWEDREENEKPGRIWTQDLAISRRVLYRCATTTAQKLIMDTQLLKQSPDLYLVFGCFQGFCGFRNDLLEDVSVEKQVDFFRGLQVLHHDDVTD